MLEIIVYYFNFSGDETLHVGRYNANNVDLNRDFPDQFWPDKVTQPLQPEVKAIMEWIRAYPFVLSAAFHEGNLLAVYPFDDTKSGEDEYSATPDDQMFKQLADAYSMVSTCFLSFYKDTLNILPPEAKAQTYPFGLFRVYHEGNLF